ncbi:MAG TPA: RimK/LysX family protein [Thermoanaerobaculia bacterium]|nr:RimK/LysX family protein [Thermoanaerobaculia bacterium]
MLAPPESGPSPVLVGWKEYLDLPELGVRRLKAKLDTGARTSALHVDAMEVSAELPDGSATVTFSAALDRRRPERRIEAQARMLRRIRVIDSGGHPEIRPLISTELVLGPVRKRILLTLTDRSGMLFHMILGRKALEGDFVVDPARMFLLRAWHRRRRSGEGA